MPRALHPNIKHKIVLESDKNTEPQPAFFYKSLNGEEWLKLVACEDIEPKNQTEATESIYSALATGLVGWEHMTDPHTGEPIPFKTENLKLVIDPIEAMNDLLPKIIKTVQLTEEQRVNFD